MRAHQPDLEGWLDRDGVAVHWEVHGTGSPTILLLPTWSIVPSLHWKFQVPWLAREHRVVTFDGRGSGRSDRPQGPEHYTVETFAGDALAVLDETGTEVGRVGRALVRDPVGGRARGAAPGAGARPCSRSGLPWDWRPSTPSARCTRSKERSTRPRSGPSTTPSTGCATIGTSSSSSAPGCSPSHIPPRLGTTSSVGALDIGPERLIDTDHGISRYTIEQLLRRGRPAALPGPRDPRLRGCNPRARSRRRSCRRRRWRARDDGRQRARTTSARSDRCQPRHQGVRRHDGTTTRHPTGASPHVGSCFPTPAASAVPLLTDRARARPARRRDRRRVAQAPPRPADRLARPTPCDESSRATRGARPPGVGVAGQRVGPHRTRIRRARPARIPGDPRHGRDPRQQLHGVPRPRRRGALRPRDRRRGMGRRLLHPREPRAEAVRVRLDDRLRRLAADAERRRSRSLGRRRLQRRDDRAARPVSTPARQVDLRRRSRRHRARFVRPRVARDP